jgi:hypothetical protein
MNTSPNGHLIYRVAVDLDTLSLYTPEEIKTIKIPYWISSGQLEVYVIIRPTEDNDGYTLPMVNDSKDHLYFYNTDKDFFGSYL